MTVVAGTILPHAPALTLDPPPRPLGSSSKTIRAAIDSVQLGDCDVVVVASPHAAATGVYSGIGGSLEGFGIRGKTVTAEVPVGGAEDLADKWGYPVVEPPVDHGIVGALLLETRLALSGLLAVGIAGATGPAPPGDCETAMHHGAALAEAVEAFSDGRRVGFVASAHTAAALGAGAPLLDRPEGHELDQRVLAALRADPADLAGIEPGLWRAAGSCGAGPLSAFGLLFGGRRAEVLAYESPAGVGYIVARSEGS